MCGSDYLLPGSVPERIDGAFAAVDDDGDTQVDEALPPTAEAYDCDGDGFTGARESGTPLCGNAVNDDAFEDSTVNDGCPGGPPQEGLYSEAQFNIGLTDQDPCGNNGWPADLFDVPPLSANKLTVQDLTSFIAPVYRLNTSPGDAAFSSRWDLLPGRGVFAKFINATDLVAIIPATTTSTARPPMLGGQPAYGQTCPWPP